METEKPVKKKRIRLDKKQRQFLSNVFEDLQSVRFTLQSLRIRPQTLRRWLTKPVFIDALEARLSCFNLQSRIEIVRFAPVAAGGLGTLCSSESDKQESIRKACNDILKLHKELQNSTTAGNDEKPEKHGGKTDRLRVIREIYGNIMDKHSIRRDKFGRAKIPLLPHSWPPDKPLPSFVTQVELSEDEVDQLNSE